MDWLTKMLSSMGVGLFNQLPMLIRNVPQLATQMLPEDTPPMVAQMLQGLISKAYGAGLNWATGTSDSDVRASDFLGNYTTRDILLSREGRRIARNLGGDNFADDYLNRMAEEQTRALASAIYGEKDADKRAGSGVYSFIQDMVKTSREASRDMAMDIVGDARFHGRSLGGVDFRKPVELSQDYLNSLSPAERDLTVRELERSRREQIDQAEWLTKVVDRAYFGGKTDDGRAVSHVSGSLTKEEFSQVLSEFSRGGGFNNSDRDAVERDLRNYVQRIANGVDNVKQVLGQNTTAAQAMQMVSGLYGFNVARDNPQVFSAVTANMRDIMVRTGMDMTDLVGDQKTGKTGYLQVMAEALQGLGIEQRATATMGLMLGALNHSQQSGIYGMSDKEFSQMTANRLRYEELIGINEDSSIALLAWARNNNKEVTHLTDEDRAAFLQEMKTKGVDLSDTVSVRNYVGPDMYSVYRGTATVKAAFDANAKLWAQTSAERSKGVYKDARERFRQVVGDATYEELKKKFGGREIFQQSAIEAEKAMLSFGPEERKKLLNAFKREAGILQDYNLPVQERVDVSYEAVTERLSTQYSPSSPLEAVQQYLAQQQAEGKDPTLAGLASAALGTPVAEDSEAAKMLKGTLNDWSKSGKEKAKKDADKIKKLVKKVMPEASKVLDTESTGNSSKTSETDKSTSSSAPDAKSTSGTPSTNGTQEELIKTMNATMNVMQELIKKLDQRHNAVTPPTTDEGK